MKKSYPSWLYPVTKGATTIWERWDGIKPDGSFQDPGMNSFNHYAYGAIGDWMYSNITGINTDQNSPGFHKILITPHVGGGLTSAQADLQTMYGEVKSSWSLNNDIYTLNIIVPPNTTANVVLPWVSGYVTESGSNIYSLAEITNIQKTNTGLQLSVGSGTYTFSYTYKNTTPVVKH